MLVYWWQSINLPSKADSSSDSDDDDFVGTSVSLSGCGLQHTHLERLWKSLGKSCDVTELE